MQMNGYIDIHTHIGETPEFHFFDISLAALLKKMDSLNIAYAINAHMDNLLLLEGNDYQATFRRCVGIYEESGKRIMNYFAFNPHRAKECIKIIKKYAGHSAFRGIKIHPSMHRTYASDPVYEQVYICASENKLPILTHSWSLSPYNDAQKYSIPKLFTKYAEMYCDVVLVLGHSGGRAEGIREAAKMAKRYPNVYLDTSGDVYPLGFIEYLVSEASTDKIMFGSDAMWICPATQLGMIEGANISRVEKIQILYDNARKVFKYDDE